MLVEANLLLFARDSDSPFHDAARTWLTGALTGAVLITTESHRSNSGMGGTSCWSRTGSIPSSAQTEPEALPSSGADK